MHNVLQNFQYFGQGGILDAFLVGQMRDNIFLKEDIFRASHQLQTIGVVLAPFIEFLCKVSAGMDSLCSSIGIDLSIDQIHLLMGSIATACTACFYRMHEHLSEDFWIWMIWLNPILIISSCVSPIPSIELLLLLFISNSPGPAPAGAFYSFMTFPAFTVLLTVEPSYLVLLPAIWVRSSATAVDSEILGESKQRRHLPATGQSEDVVSAAATASSNAIAIYLPSILHLGGLVSLLAVQFYTSRGDHARSAFSSIDSAEREAPMNSLIQTQLDVPSTFSEIARCFSMLVSQSTTLNGSESLPFSDGSVYFPSLGIIWYMDAQVFSEFRTYVSALVRSQPYLIALPIFWRFGFKQNKECVQILTAVVLLFKPTLCLSDVSIAMVMLSANRNVIMTMRRIPLICFCIVLTVCLSLLTAQLWLQQGTGNANFLFFQGLVLWIACAVGIVEFVRSVVVSLEG